MHAASRKHGCQAPWNVHQAIGIVIWWAVVAGFLALHLPLLATAAKAGVAVVYCSCVIAITVLYLAVSMKDPVDPGDTMESPERAWLCTLCERYVHRHSKHCRECNKCIEGFDHHCRWVNNCIGRHNYRSFILLLTSMCAILTLQMGVGLYLFARCFTDPAAAQLSLASYPTTVDSKGYTAAIALYLVLVLLALYPLGELWLLHMVLLWKGMTTYDYIMANRHRISSQGHSSSSSSGSGSSSSRGKEGRHQYTLRAMRMCCTARVADEHMLAAMQTSSDGAGLGSGAGIGRKKVPLNPCLAMATPLSHFSDTGGRAQPGPHPAAVSRWFDGGSKQQGCADKQPAPYSPLQAAKLKGGAAWGLIEDTLQRHSSSGLIPVGVADSSDAYAVDMPSPLPLDLPLPLPQQQQPQQQQQQQQPGAQVWASVQQQPAEQQPSAETDAQQQQQQQLQAGDPGAARSAAALQDQQDRGPTPHV